jgi:hypothetical protein
MERATNPAGCRDFSSMRDVWLIPCACGVS